MNYQDFSRLPELLVGMLADDGPTRTACGEEVASLFYGFSIHAELEEVQVPDAVQHQKEYDPDWSYDGRHERVCHVLRKFGPAALPALPRLIAIIEGIDPQEDMQRDVIELVGSLGPAARDALPALMALAGKYRLTDEDLTDDEGPLGRAITNIKGTRNGS